MKQTALDELLAQVGELCRIYVGKNAPSERWDETCQRLIEIDRTLKRVRRQRAKEAEKP